MSLSPQPEPAPGPTVHRPDFRAALLSYLVPGLGQIYQKRLGKGLLFLVSLYALFFYGMWMGSGANVYLPHTAEPRMPDLPYGAPPPRNNPWNMPEPLANLYNRLQFVGQFWIGAAAWPAIVQYVTYEPPPKDSGPIFGTFQRQPRDERLNDLQREGDKRWDLAWVYTVIAGVLNILVIYDAYAGPTFAAAESRGTRPEDQPEEAAA